jgi:predicted RNA-binding protein (virulence factor B family)
MPSDLPYESSEPDLEPGDVVFLRVTALTPIGAFVDWGLPKELLIPFAEQTHDLEVGERLPIGVIVDKSGRFAGTMKVREMLSSRGDFELGEWVLGEAWRKEPGIGVFVIVERRYLGLLPETEPHALQRGDSAEFRVSRILQDGKIELSLRGQVHEQLEADAEHVLATLQLPAAPRLSDQSDPEDIRAALGLSKKAFKRAVGRLLRDGLVELDDNGDVRVRRS